MDISNMVGSKWWKIDFHSHTPASLDYGERETLPKEWLLSYMKAEIDGVAITDHNSGEWINSLKKAKEELKSEKDPQYREILLIPGVEMTLSSGMHFLALFPEDFTSEKMISFLAKCGYDKDFGNPEECCQKSIKEIVDIIKEMKGIPIPAHVDDKKGLFYMNCKGTGTANGTAIRNVLDMIDIMALEIKKSDYEIPDSYSAQKRWSKVRGSDSHHLKGEKGESYPGSHYTWIKMDYPSFEGIKLALFDGETSVKEQELENPNLYSHSFIEKIEIFKTMYLGVNEKYECKFSPWLNTLIGGRGTGKSSIIEFMRNVLDKNDSLHTSLRNEYLKYKNIKDGEKEGLLTADSTLSLVYIKNKIKYRINYSQNNERSVEEFNEEDKKWKKIETDIQSRFIIDIFSQKEIFEIAKDPDSLLEKINEAEEIGYETFQKDSQSLKNNFKKNQNRIREINTLLNEEIKLRGKIGDIEGKIKLFENPESKEILDNYKKIKKQENQLKNLDEIISNKIEKIRIEIDELKDIRIENDDFMPEEVIEIDEFLTEIREIKNNLIENLNLINFKNTEFKRTSNSYQKINDYNISFEKMIIDLEKEGIKIDSYKLLIEEKNFLEMELKSLETLKKEKIELESKNQDILEEMERKRKELCEKRKAFLKRVLEKNKYVKINIVPYKNVNKIEKELREILACSNKYDRDIRCDGNIEIGSPKTGITWEIYSDKNSLIKSKRVKEKLVDVYSNAHADTSWINDSRFCSHLKKLNPESIDELMCWFPEDGLRIEYKDSNGEFKEIDTGSPGQKTAALLSFILSYGNNPLILDQPEDDLDNKLITELIVSQIKIQKINRQIILATHNANIVVNGDAENIIILGEDGETSSKGGLQNKNIRNKICEIMEGGNRAFEERYRRIRIDKL